MTAMRPDTIATIARSLTTHEVTVEENRQPDKTWISLVVTGLRGPAAVVIIRNGEIDFATFSIVDLVTEQQVAEAFVGRFATKGQ